MRLLRRSIAVRTDRSIQLFRIALRNDNAGRLLTVADPSLQPIGAAALPFNRDTDLLQRFDQLGAVRASVQVRNQDLDGRRRSAASRAVDCPEYPREHQRQAE